MTVKSKEIIITFIGLKVSLVGIKRFIRNNVNRYNKRLIYPRPVVLV